MQVESIQREGERGFLIRWAGYSAEHDSWEPEANINAKLVADFRLQQEEAERYRAEDEEYGRKVALRNACEEALFKVKGGGDELDEIRDWLDADADEATLDEIMAKAKLLNDNHKAGIEFTADGTVKVSSAEGWSD